MMATADKSKKPSDRRLTEVAYHKRMNRLVLIWALPGFLFFTGFHFYLGNKFQALIFSLLFLNAGIGLLLGMYIIKDIKRLTLLKQVGAAIAFALLGISLLTGMLSKDVYIFFPWIFMFPMMVVLFASGRIGAYTALAFCLAAAVIILGLHLPPWTKWASQMVKLNTILSLASLLAISLITERTRVHIRNDLLKAQNEYKMAEQRQRETNVELQREIELRTESERALAQSEIRYRALFEESAVSLWEEDWSAVKQFMDDLPQEAADDFMAYFKANSDKLISCFNKIQVMAVNRSTLTLYGADTTETLINNLPAIMPSSNMKYMAHRIISLYETGQYNDQVETQALDQRPLHLLVSSTIPAGFEQSWQKVFTSVYDITEQVAVEKERKRVDEKFQNARQIQAIATLAGGIAHQFNNALGVIKGNIDLLEFNAKGSTTEDAGFIQALRISTDRMNRLTDQLLAYARGGKYQPKTFSANDLIKVLLETEPVNANPYIRINTRLSPDILMADGDITQIRMVLEAVLANALESMSEGGEVTISTRNQHLKRAGAASDLQLAPGNYTVITISDTGVGMDEQTCQRIFEPFFSTKFVGRGLGMAAAFGIVRNHDGMITVASKPGQGTSVKIYLPGLDYQKKSITPERSQHAA